MDSRSPQGAVDRLDPSGQIVTYWHPYSGFNEELLLSMIDEFNRTNGANITVQGESLGSSSNLHQTVLARIPSRKLPNLILAYPYQAAAYAAHGVLAPLEPYITSERWGYLPKEMGDFLPQVLAADISPQSQARYTWPFYKTMELMYYNEDWLAEMGTTQPPESWDQFAELACRGTGQPFSGVTGDRPSYGYVYALDPVWFAALVASRGGEIINADGSAYVFNGPAGLEALTSLKEWVARGCAQEQTERNSDRVDFSAGRVLFDISPAHYLSCYAEAVKDGAGFHWGVAPLPHTTTEPQVNIYGMGHSIFVSRPEEQLAAWLFIKWLSEPAQQARWASATGYFPIRKGAADLLSDYFAAAPLYEEAFKWMLLESRAEAPVAGYDECQVVINSMLAAVMRGEDIQTQLDAAVRQCNERLTQPIP